MCLFKHISGLWFTIPTQQTKRQSKLFCLDFILLFVPDYLNYPYYLSLPIVCYQIVITFDNSNNISQFVCKIIIADIS